MNDKNTNISNKKNAGKGNGNSIINSTGTNDAANNYVSADAFPSSISHKFGTNDPSMDEEAE
jgi:hypothetical protein